MTFKSLTQPYCRCCGKPIAKAVVTHYFSQSNPSFNGFPFYHHPESAKTKAEAQRLVNGRIVSVRKDYNGEVIAGVWDGESYEDEHFHSQSCAAAFGRMAAGLYPRLETKESQAARLARTQGNV